MGNAPPSVVVSAEKRVEEYYTLTALPSPLVGIIVSYYWITSRTDLRCWTYQHPSEMYTHRSKWIPGDILVLENRLRESVVALEHQQIQPIDLFEIRLRACHIQSIGV